jgi:ATPase subunit of ABC transporter with duplicated ATPase domains
MDALRTPDGDTNQEPFRRRASCTLCRLLLQQPDVLLLDEPTNPLDASVLWLEQHLLNIQEL